MAAQSSKHDLDAAEIARLTGTAGGTTPSGRPSATTGIVRGDGADWLGPQNPIGPLAPEEVEGRQFDIPVGYNLQTRTRPYEPVSFHEMRALADAYDVLRLVIETRKDQMARLPWAIGVRNGADGKPLSNPPASLIQEVTNFFLRPAPTLTWTVWLKKLLEDMFVIDAASIYVHRLAGGKLLALEPIDGATMKPVIDDWGRTPAPPICAYQQILKGMPAVNYTTDDLIYAPRNRRTNHVYGYSPVEQIITTVNIGLERLFYQLMYYRAGNLPDGFVNAPEGWTPEQIAATQKAWNRMRSGNTEERSGKIVFIPAGAKYIPAKDPDLTGKTDEWLARKVCYAFSVPPTPFVTQVNRATAESAHDAALEEGLAPIQVWVKELVDECLARGWPNSGLEFQWGDDREIDAAVQEVVLTGYATKGLRTINECRDVLGLEPKDGGDQLMVLTPTGYVPIGVNADMPTAGEAAQQKSDQAAASAAALASQPKPGAPGTEPAPAPDDKGAAAAKLAKYSDDQPRADNGQFGEGEGEPAKAPDVSKMPLLGEGASRKVYDAGDGTVIKVAKNAAAKKDNKSEVEASGKNDLLAKVSDHAKDYSWIQQEKLDPASDKDLAKAFGVSDKDASKTYTVQVKGPPGWPDQTVTGKNWLFAAVHSADGMSGEKPKSARAFIDKLKQLKSDVPKLDVRDLAYSNQWGISKSGAAKIADYGFTKMAKSAEGVAADPPDTFRPTLRKQRELAKTYWGPPRRPAGDKKELLES